MLCLPCLIKYTGCMYVIASALSVGGFWFIPVPLTYNNCTGKHTSKKQYLPVLSHHFGGRFYQELGVKSPELLI